ncbi:hypothetical protein GCK32_017486 [Trichostrongylus colubriformis]|uniref:Uncharacterized protein n=1 Tax=Trichostrongylus colubriformis TaxID=6319 RepID=A0AAN8FIK7_TRICO
MFDLCTAFKRTFLLRLPLIGLSIFCLILIVVIIALVMNNRGMQHELRKRDLERGAGTLRKGPKSSSSSEVPTGSKSKEGVSADKTVGSKESGSTEKAKSLTDGQQQHRSKE